MSYKLAYLAGYFDGEGCVYVRLDKNKTIPQLVIQIRSADKESLLQFVETFGGKLLPCKSKKRALYTWSIVGTRAQEALQAMEPYLVAKLPVAQLGLKLNFGMKGKHTTQEEKENRLEIRKQISNFNQRVTVH